MRVFFAFAATATFGLVLSGTASPAMRCSPAAGCLPLRVVDGKMRERRSDAVSILREVNVFRARARAAALREDPQLDAIARGHAIDMIRNRFFSHDSSDGRSFGQRIASSGVRYRFAGENIGLSANAARASAELWADPPHRTNRLEPHFGRVGIVAIETHGAGELIVEDYTD